MYQLRDRLARRNPVADEDNPEALDAAAEMLDAIHGHVLGCISSLGGHREPPAWRKVVTANGESPFSMVDLAYLATRPTSEPRAAVRAVITILQRLVGDEPASAGSLATCAAKAANSATALLGQVARAQEDGKVDESERTVLRRTLVQLAHAVDAISVRLYAGEGR